MTNLAVEVIQKHHRSIRYYRAIEWLTCELAYGFKGFPEGDHDDFNGVVNVALKKHGVAKAIELFQFGEHGGLKVACVMRSLFAIGTRRPVSCNH
jgi:hypothetical protein